MKQRPFFDGVKRCRRRPRTWARTVAWLLIWLWLAVGVGLMIWATWRMGHLAESCKPVATGPLPLALAPLSSPVAVGVFVLGLIGTAVAIAMMVRSQWRQEREKAQAWKRIALEQRGVCQRCAMPTAADVKEGAQDLQ